MMHGHIQVNGKKVDIPSYIVKDGDVVSVSSKAASKDHFKLMKEQGEKTTPKWLELDMLISREGHRAAWRDE